MMDYRMLYEKLVAEAEENGLGGEFVDWGISISKWRATRWRSPVRMAAGKRAGRDGREVGKANRLGDGNRRNGIEQAA